MLGLVADCYGVMVSIISMIMMAAAIPSSGWGSVVRALTLVLRVRVGQQVDPGRYATTHTGTLGTSPDGGLTLPS